MNSLEHILRHRIVAILRGCAPERVMDIVAALADGGVRLLEITLNSPGALDLIRRVAGTMGDRVLVGAGTVMTPAEAEMAIDAGAKFILSPSLDADTIRVTKELGAISVPGAFTATEIVMAWRNGADIVKVFPASVGASYLRDLRGPLPQIRLMPTGGVNLDNIREFRAAGAVAYGIGSALVPAGQETTAEALDALKTTCCRLYKSVSMNLLISCDWGTTNFRLRLVDSDRRESIGEVSGPEGVAAVYSRWRESGLGPKERLGFYQAVLAKEIEHLRRQTTYSLTGLPLVMSGMASSSIGMVELPLSARADGADGAGAYPGGDTGDRRVRTFHIAGFGGAYERRCDAG